MKRCNNLVDEGRRQFLRGGAIATASAAAAVVVPAQAEKEICLCLGEGR